MRPRSKAIALTYEILKEIAHRNKSECIIAAYATNHPIFSIGEDPELRPTLLIQYDPEGNTYYLAKMASDGLHRFGEISSSDPEAIPMIEEKLRALRQTKGNSGNGQRPPTEEP